MKTKIELNARAINKIKTTGKRYDLRIKGPASRGLLIRVGTNGSKTWAFWQKIPNSKDVFYSTFGKLEVDAHNNVKPSNIDEALAWAANQREAIKTGKTKVRAKRQSQGPIVLKDLFDEYIKNHCDGRNRESTVKNNQSLWKLHISPEFSEVTVTDITYADIDAFINLKHSKLREQGGNGGRANNILALLSSMMNFALKRQYIKSNPCFGISKFKTEHSWPEMTDHQRNTLREIAKSHSQMMGLIIDFALITGARKQEILKMRWEEIKGDIWTIPKDRKKGKKEHVLRLPPKLSASLTEWRQREGIIDSRGRKAKLIRNTGFVFPSISKQYNGTKNKKSGSYENAVPETERPAMEDIKSAWTFIREKADMTNFRFHDLRHDFGTQSAKAKVDVYTLMYAMGHQRIETTMLYINKAGLDGHEAVLADREKNLDRCKNDALEEINFSC